MSTTRVELEWGITGARHCSADVAVVVDVLSFTTTLGVACERGIDVLPFAYDRDAAAFAVEHDAVLAGSRLDSDPQAITLSPRTIRDCTDPPTRLVLPSPNGSTISQLLSTNGRVVVAASLRNAGAVAAYLAENHAESAIVVAAAGERWADGSLRPAIEDLWGAGAVLDALARRHDMPLSPAASAAAHTWRGAVANPGIDLTDTASDRELAAMGFADDVQIAGEIGESTTVPIMVGPVYVAAG